jgi:hypothetical protein
MHSCYRSERNSENPVLKRKRNQRFPELKMKVKSRAFLEKGKQIPASLAVLTKCHHG